MYLSSEQVAKYAEEILSKLGAKKRYRYEGLFYEDGTFEIQQFPKSPLEIRCGGRLVFVRDNNNIITFIRGRWELVLVETYSAIPKILAKRKEEERERAWAEKFARECARYLKGYHDNTIKVVVNFIISQSLSGVDLKIYEKRRVVDWFPLKCKSVLVFVWHPRGWIEEPEDNIVYNGVVDSGGSWRQHIDNLLKEKRREAIERAKEIEAIREKETERKLNESLERLKSL